MNRLALIVAAMVAACVATGVSRAEEQAAPEKTVASPVDAAQASAPAPAQASADTKPAAQPLSPEAQALSEAVAGLPAGATDEERNERADLVSFYTARRYAPLWLTAASGFTPKAKLLMSEIGRADEWGLDPKDLALPSETPAPTSSHDLAAAEMKLATAILKYGRYARGGRIMDPASQLSSYLDRRPQLLKASAILEGIAASEEPDAYLRSLHPPHPQFEKLRLKYVALLKQKKQKSAEAKKLLANMEEWRWMPVEMGDLYVWNNIPDFTQRVVKDGKIIRQVRIVAGETDKQTPVFTRPMRKITFKPTWIVPDSIKVRELLPDMLRGGGMMSEWKLEVHAKDGQLVNWRRVDWDNTDIRKFEVTQPNGPKSVMGKVKFSFPNQHTVFMHDTLDRDKWMFRSAKRTYSHGCMRVANPVGLAEIILREDKGWDVAHVREALSEGPNNNEIALEHKVPVHMTYFTALVDDDGKLRTFPDVYGHERRIALALEGKWDRIVKGRNHLAPVELTFSDASQSRSHMEPDDEREERRAAPEWQGMRRGREASFSDRYYNGYSDGYYGPYYNGY